MEHLTNWYTLKCEEANYNRLGVMAFILLVQTCIIIPATLLSISMNGNNLIEFVLIAISSFGVLVSLLGDMPSKVVLPIFACSTLINLAIIFINVI